MRRGPCRMSVGPAALAQRVGEVSRQFLAPLEERAPAERQRRAGLVGVLHPVRCLARSDAACSSPLCITRCHLSQYRAPALRGLPAQKFELFLQAVQLVHRLAQRQPPAERAARLQRVIQLAADGKEAGQNFRKIGAHLLESSGSQSISFGTVGKLLDGCVARQHIRGDVRFGKTCLRLSGQGVDKEGNFIQGGIEVDVGQLAQEACKPKEGEPDDFVVTGRITSDSSVARQRAGSGSNQTQQPNPHHFWQCTGTNGG